jgi:hypothetical protein
VRGRAPFHHATASPLISISDGRLPRIAQNPFVAKRVAPRIHHVARPLVDHIVPCANLASRHVSANIGYFVAVQ